MMNKVILNRLNGFFEAEPFFKAGGVDEASIDAAQAELGVTFIDDYRQFLRIYGGALIGPYPVYGLARVEPMDESLWSVVTVTQHFRRQEWPEVGGWYVISMDHAGNPIGVDESGNVVTYDHDAGARALVAESFEDYLRQRLARL
jgi:cell wall assembly regulator SMI1